MLSALAVPLNIAKARSWASNTVFLRLARIGGISERFQVTGAFAEFERSMIRQRVQCGPARPVAVIPFLSSDEVREHHPGRRISVAPSGVHGAGSASRRSSILLELGLGGKFQAKSSGWDENRTFLEGDILEVAVRNGRWVLCHIPAGPRPAPAPAQHYFPTEE